MENKSIWEADESNLEGYKKYDIDLIMRDIDNNTLIDSMDPLSETVQKDAIKLLVKQSMMCRGVDRAFYTRKRMLRMASRLHIELRGMSSKLKEYKSNMKKLSEKVCIPQGSLALFDEKEMEEIFQYFKTKIEYEKTKSVMKEKENTLRMLKETFSPKQQENKPIKAEQEL